MAARFLVEYSIGDAGSFHAREPGAGRRATFHSVEQPTVVLGSAQGHEAVDRGVAEALGLPQAAIEAGLARLDGVRARQRSAADENL